MLLQKLPVLVDELAFTLLFEPLVHLRDEFSKRRAHELGTTTEISRFAVQLVDELQGFFVHSNSYCLHNRKYNIFILLLQCRDAFLETVRVEPEFQALMDEMKAQWEAVPEFERQPFE